MKKAKGQKIIEQENEDQVRKDKRQKQKKKKKQHNQNGQKQRTQQQQKEQQVSKKQEDTKKYEKEKNKNNLRSSQSQAIDPLSQQLSKLTFTPQLTPSLSVCQLINSHLQQLTINLYQTMIMKSSLITSTIQIAKKQLLTPKQYFAIDYTNKLLLIKELLKENGEVKYNRFVKMIDEEVDRVEGLILKCMDEVVLFDQVLMDLKKNNIEWEVNQLGNRYCQ